MPFPSPGMLQLQCTCPGRHQRAAATNCKQTAPGAEEDEEADLSRAHAAPGGTQRTQQLPFHDVACTPAATVPSRPVPFAVATPMPTPTHYHCMPRCCSCCCRCVNRNDQKLRRAKGDGGIVSLMLVGLSVFIQCCSFFFPHSLLSGAFALASLYHSG